MATLNVIRRWALRDQLSIREIARRTGLARNTVKKYLRSDQTEPQYAKRVSSSKLDPYAEKLATWLDTEVTRSRKQRRTLRQIHTASCEQTTYGLMRRFEATEFRLANILDAHAHRTAPDLPGTTSERAG